MNARNLGIHLLGTSALAVASFAVAQTRVTFNDMSALPKNWTTGITGSGAAKWAIVSDDTAPSAPQVLRQSGEATFCWAVNNEAKLKDGFVEVKLKPISGKEDQAGGLVWRFRDANNYYVVRANALEGNVVLYKTVNGKRSSLQVKGRMFGYGMDTKVSSGKWSTLRVDFEGTLFTVTFQGQKLFEVEDDTFRDSGAVGVWTKADSVTEFDDFTFGAKEP
jgi:hypothetical protein